MTGQRRRKVGEGKRLALEVKPTIKMIVYPGIVDEIKSQAFNYLLSGFWTPRVKPFGLIL